MARELNLSTQKQEFLKKSYLKEVQTRISWWRRYRQNVRHAPHLKAKVKDHFKLPTINDSSIQAQTDKKNSPDVQGAQNLRDSRKSNQMETSPVESEMKPVSPETQMLLYQGTSKEEKGRYAYLKIRNRLGPDEKYCYPLATSWEYGWHLGNHLDTSCPQYRRCHIVTDTFYRKNGIPATQPTLKDMAL